MARFSGVGVALVSLFRDDLALDAVATAALAAALVDEGVRAVLVAGTTGEAVALEPSERLELLDAVRAAVPTAVPVIAGTGAPSARQAVALTRAAVDHGADAILALSPPGTTECRPYYEDVGAAARDLPLLAYHYPAVSAPGIPVEVLAGLPVSGCKDSSGDPERLALEVEAFPGDLYTGSSALLSFAGPLGCTGAILALANVDPVGCARAFSGDAEAQRALTSLHARAHGRFPHGLKHLLAERRGVSAAARLS